MLRSQWFHVIQSSIAKLRTMNASSDRTIRRWYKPRLDPLEDRLAPANIGWVIGEGGDGVNWSNPSNWRNSDLDRSDPARVPVLPGPGDNVFVGINSVVDTPFSIGRFFLGGSGANGFSIGPAGSLTVTAPKFDNNNGASSVGHLSIAAGGNLTLGNGSAVLVGGKSNYQGSIVVGNNADFIIGQNVLEDQHTLIGSTAQFNIEAGGTFQAIRFEIFDVAAGAQIVGEGFFQLDAPMNLNGDLTAANFQLGSAGKLSGPAKLTVGDTLKFSGGTFTGGVVDVLSTASLNIDGPVVVDGGTINNHGSAVVTSNTMVSGALTLRNGSVVNNLAGATFDLQNQSQVGVGSNPGATATFNNAGSLTRSLGVGSAGVSYIGDQVEFNNTGTVAVGMGTLNIGRGVNTGSFQVDTNAVLELSVAGQTFNLNTGTAFSGAGKVRLGTGPIAIGGGILNVNADVTVPNLHLDNGDLNGPANITVTNTLDWGDGKMIGTGATTLAAGATANGLGGFQRIEGRTFNNLGTAVGVAANVSLGGVVNNTGQFDWGIAGATIGANSVFRNSAPAGGSGNLRLDGGKLEGTGTVTAPRLESIQGTISPGGNSAGVLTLVGDYSSFGSGVIDIQIGGTTAGANYDRFVIDGEIGGGSGVINVSRLNNFIPQLTNVFEIIQFDTGAASFSTVNGLDFGGVATLATSADNNSFDITVTSTTGSGPVPPIFEGFVNPEDLIVAGQTLLNAAANLILVNSGASGADLAVKVLNPLLGTVLSSFSLPDFPAWTGLSDRTLAGDVNNDGVDELVQFNRPDTSGGARTGGAVRFLNAATGAVVDQIDYEETTGGQTYAQLLDSLVDPEDEVFLGHFTQTAQLEAFFFNRTNQNNGSVSLRVINLVTGAVTDTGLHNGVNFGGWLDATDEYTISDTNFDGLDDLVIINRDPNFTANRATNLGFVGMVSLANVGGRNGQDIGFYRFFDWNFAKPGEPSVFPGYDELDDSATFGRVMNNGANTPVIVLVNSQFDGNPQAAAFALLQPAQLIQGVRDSFQLISTQFRSNPVLAASSFDVDDTFFLADTNNDGADEFVTFSRASNEIVIRIFDSFTGQLVSKIPSQNGGARPVTRPGADFTGPTSEKVVALADNQVALPSHATFDAATPEKSVGATQDATQRRYLANAVDAVFSSDLLGI